MENLDKKLDWGNALKVFTGVVFVMATGWGVVTFAYDQGRKDESAEKQVELNTQAKENLGSQLDKLEKAEETKHGEMMTTIHIEIAGLQKIVEKTEQTIKELIDQQVTYLNEEDDGVKGDLLELVRELRESIKRIEDKQTTLESRLRVLEQKVL